MTILDHDILSVSTLSIMVMSTYNKNINPECDEWMANALAFGEQACDERTKYRDTLVKYRFFIVCMKYQSITQLKFV